MHKYLSTRIKNRIGSAVRWTATNPILLAGEIGIEQDTGYIKIGDGSTPWNKLGYLQIPNMFYVKSIPKATAFVELTD